MPQQSCSRLVSEVRDRSHINDLRLPPRLSSLRSSDFLRRRCWGRICKLTTKGMTRGRFGDCMNGNRLWSGQPMSRIEASLLIAAACLITLGVGWTFYSWS
jgi:hypothetical protein